MSTVYLKHFNYKKHRTKTHTGNGWNEVYTQNVYTSMITNLYCETSIAYEQSLAKGTEFSVNI